MPCFTCQNIFLSKIHGLCWSLTDLAIIVHTRFLTDERFEGLVVLSSVVEPVISPVEVPSLAAKLVQHQQDGHRLQEEDASKHRRHGHSTTCPGIVVYITAMEEQQLYQIKACPTINGGRQEEVHCADSAVTEGYDRTRIVFQ